MVPQTFRRDCIELLASLADKFAGVACTYEYPVCPMSLGGYGEMAVTFEIRSTVTKASFSTGTFFSLIFRVLVFS